MRGEKREQLYRLYKREEEGRKERVKRNSQGTEIILYFLLIFSNMVMMVIGEKNMVPLMMSSFALQNSIITALYYWPIFYEKEGTKYKFLLKKYLYVPVSLKQLSLVKIMLYFSKISKLYGIDLIAILISGVISTNGILVIRKTAVLGAFFLLFGIYTCIVVAWQYRKL